METLPRNEDHAVEIPVPAGLAQQMERRFAVPRPVVVRRRREDDAAGKRRAVLVHSQKIEPQPLGRDRLFRRSCRNVGHKIARTAQGFDPYLQHLVIVRLVAERYIPPPQRTETGQKLPENPVGRGRRARYRFVAGIAPHRPADDPRKRTERSVVLSAGCDAECRAGHDDPEPSLHKQVCGASPLGGTRRKDRKNFPVSEMKTHPDRKGVGIEPVVARERLFGSLGGGLGRRFGSGASRYGLLIDDTVSERVGVGVGTRALGIGGGYVAVGEVERQESRGIQRETGREGHLGHRRRLGIQVVAPHGAFVHVHTQTGLYEIAGFVFAAEAERQRIL